MSDVTENMLNVKYFRATIVLCNILINFKQKIMNVIFLSQTVL